MAYLYIPDYGDICCTWDMIERLKRIVEDENISKEEMKKSLLSSLRVINSFRDEIDNIGNDIKKRIMEEVEERGCALIPSEIDEIIEEIVDEECYFDIN